MVETCSCPSTSGREWRVPTVPTGVPAGVPPAECSCPAALRDPRTVRRSWCWWWWRPEPGVLLAVAVVLCAALPLLTAAATADSEGGGVSGHHQHHHHHLHNSSVPIARAGRPAKHSHRGQQHQHPHRRAESLPEDGDDDDDDLDEEDMIPRPGCASCRLRGELRSLSLESIKEQILHKLNLQQAPNMTGRKIPNIAHISELLDAHPRHSSFGMQGDDPGAFRPGPEVFEEEDNFHAKTERLIAFAQTHPNKVRHRWRGQNVLHFRFSQKVMQSQVAKATLWLWVRGSGEEDPWGETVTVSVMRMQRGSQESLGAQGSPGSQGSQGSLHAPDTTVKLARPDGRGGWVTVDMKKMVEDWFRRPKENLGLVVLATDSSDRQVVSTDPNEEDGTHAPFVEVYLTDGRKRRVRRNVGLNCHENSEESRCCRYPLTVDFEAFGWDFIIAPKKYEANYCSGECPYIFMQKYPHTALVHLANREAGPCCAPRKMSAITMLYFDSDFNIVYGHLPGMVVDRCGCS